MTFEGDLVFLGMCVPKTSFLCVACFFQLTELACVEFLWLWFFAFCLFVCFFGLSMHVGYLLFKIAHPFFKSQMVHP